MFYVYIVENENKLRYIGYTINLERRLYEHNDTKKKNAFTFNKGPWKLIYKECLQTKKEAMGRERFFKSGRGRVELKNILH